MFKCKFIYVYTGSVLVHQDSSILDIYLIYYTGIVPVQVYSHIMYGLEYEIKRSVLLKFNDSSISEDIVVYCRKIGLCIVHTLF